MFLGTFFGTFNVSLSSLTTKKMEKKQTNMDCCLPKDNTENIITICKDSWSETSATQGSYETFLLRVLVQCFQIMAIIVRKYFLLNRVAVSSFVLQRSTQLLVQSRDGRQAESLF